MTTNQTDTVTNTSSSSLLALTQGPLSVEITVSYGERTLVQRRLERQGLARTARGMVYQLALLGVATLTVAAALFVWRLSEVKTNMGHRRAMEDWARTHVDAARFIPGIPSRPLLEGTVLLLTAGGLLASLLAFQKHRRQSNSAAFTLGDDPRCSFPSSDHKIETDRFPLVEAHDAGFRMCITPSMKGQVELAGGKTLTLKEAACSPAAYPHPDWPGTHVVDLPPHCRCWVEMGPVTVTIEDSET